MIFYIIGLFVLLIILSAALYVLYRSIDQRRRVRDHTHSVSYDEEAIIDELITELTEKNQTQENEDKTAQSKENVLETFIELHRTGSFCTHLSEQEVICFVKEKLNMEMHKNG